MFPLFPRPSYLDFADLVFLHLHFSFNYYYIILIDLFVYKWILLCHGSDLWFYLQLFDFLKWIVLLQNAPLTEQQQTAIVSLSHAVSERPLPLKLVSFCHLRVIDILTKQLKCNSGMYRLKRMRRCNTMRFPLKRRIVPSMTPVLLRLLWSIPIRQVVCAIWFLAFNAPHEFIWPDWLIFFVFEFDAVLQMVCGSWICNEIRGY